MSLPAHSPEKENELAFDEIIRIANEARAMGCRRWAMSGGEPMLRPDFAEIFDYLTCKSATYSLNTNGTLITPQIARLMKRKGAKMVALYGATAEVHDHITRTPGSFEAAMQGFAYLKETGAGFTVQIVPMKDNHHQLNDMVRLAESLSPLWRIGATWLHLSASGDPERNREILGQRLPPGEVVALDKPDLSLERGEPTEGGLGCRPMKGHARLFASCIAAKRDFHIDPYGRMSFCSFIRDGALRCDLKTEAFQEGWDVFLPSLAEKATGGKEYDQSCGSCGLRQDCLWCPAFGYLEHRCFSGKIEYLCDLAQETRKFREARKRDHGRCYQIAGITVRVDSELPIRDTTFSSKFNSFETDGPGEDTITLTHIFTLPDLSREGRGVEVYRRPPWAIYRKGNSWIYVGLLPDPEDQGIDSVSVFNQDHSRGMMYHSERQKALYVRGNLESLTMFPTDQILLARVLADRGGCYLHSAGAILENKGLLFVGHSDAGKSTMATMLKGKAEILCDDRIIVREEPKGFRMYGTWSHGDVADVSANSAPLSALLFLRKAQRNAVLPIGDKGEKFRKLLPFLIKPLETRDWWDRMLDLIQRIAASVPFYSLEFDRSGGVIDLLKEL
ncbi:MAG: radical SAM protein [Desulfobacterota bacterium]|nr:radical SAM protein [Thermodesulfobacteriota bacterium]